MALTLSQGLLRHHCPVRASKCPHGSCSYFGFPSLTVVFKTTSRSTFPYGESQRFQVPGLSDFKHVPIEGTPGDVGAQQWQGWPQAAERAVGAGRLQRITPACLGPVSSTQALQGSPGPHGFLEMQLGSVPAGGGGNTALNCDSQKICRIFFSCHLEAAFFFQ